MTAGSFSLAAYTPAALAVSTPPSCTDNDLTSGTIDNGNGTETQVLLGSDAGAAGTGLTLPNNVLSVSVDVCGAQGTTGGAAGGLGGRTTGTFTVSSGDNLWLVAGSQDGTAGNGGTAGSGAGAGGGYSGVFTGSSASQAAAVFIAGGGGGGGGTGVPAGGPGAGGAGGGTTGVAGAFGSGGKFINPSGGGGGSQAGPGSPDAGGNAAALQGGNGGAGGTSSGGGGGGGYYGGGGGGGGNFDGFTFSGGAGGGGGSGFVSSDASVTSGTTNQAVRSGQGAVILTYSTSHFTTPQFDDQVELGAPYTRTITSDTPVATISIDSGGVPPGITFTDNGDGTATLDGAPTSLGSYPFGVGLHTPSVDETQDDSITIVQSPTFTNGPPPNTTYGVPYSFTYTVTGSPVAAITLDSGTLPPGLTLTDNHDNTATLAGTPTHPGGYTFTVRADAGTATDATRTDTVKVFSPPAAPVSESPSPSASASPSPSTSPSATPTATTSPSASPSASPSPSCGMPTVRVNTTTVNATGLASVTVTNAPAGSTVELQGYSQDHFGSVNFGNDPTPVDRTGVADANGTVTFDDLRPASNTRLRARVAGCAYGTNSGLINVRATETLKVTRTGTLTYRFSGQSIPARPGGLVVSLYKVVGQTCAAGVEPASCPGEVFLGQSRAIAAGAAGAGGYSMTVRFDRGDAGRHSFVVKTGRDAQNAPGRSNVRSLLIF